MIGPTRFEARARGLTRYFGKICAKHPELGGERVTRTCKCVGCRRDRHKAKRKGDIEITKPQPKGMKDHHPELNLNNTQFRRDLEAWRRDLACKEAMLRALIATVAAFPGIHEPSGVGTEEVSTITGTHERDLTA